MNRPARVVLKHEVAGMARASCRACWGKGILAVHVPSAPAGERRREVVCNCAKQALAAAHEESEEAMGDYCEELGYERPRRRSRLTAEQRADAAIAALKEFGVAGEAAIRRIDALQPPTPEREEERHG